MSPDEDIVSAFQAFQAERQRKKTKNPKKSNKSLQNGVAGKKPIVKNVGANELGVSKLKNETAKKQSKSSNVLSSKSVAVAAKKKVNKEKTKNRDAGNHKDPPKKQKTESKKKQQLEELENDEQLNSSEEADSEEEYSYTESDAFSNEYTINESATFSEDEEMHDEESFELPSKNLIKADRKRKKSDSSTQSKSKTSAIKTNGEVLQTKKAKSIDRQSLPNVKTLKSDDSKPRKSIATTLVNEKCQKRKVSITSVDVKLEPLSPPHNVAKVSSIDEGKRAFQWLLNPISVDEFFKKYWESNACLIKRKQSNYFSHLISFEAIDEMLIKNHVEFTKNLDVTSYINGIRETLNPEGRAMPPVVWDHYGQGCSIRLLNPHTFLPQLFTLNTTLQEFFHCLVGANAYLTPPNSQGFAPHYDDIEAFVLQIEGRKRWKLYKPRSASEILPRESSRNFTQEEIGKPILEEVLEPGDVLYFPRGTIHQACTEPGYHSLHITLSVYQKQSYADLFEKMLPMMIKKAIADNVEMRRGLPLNIWQNAGIAFSDISTKERVDFQKKVSQLLNKCIRDMPLSDLVDAAVDQVAKKFQHEALPPEVLPSEKTRTVFGSRNHTNERGECVCDYDIDERTNVRLLRANILRLVDEEDKIRIYYYLDNSKEYCEYEPNFIEIEPMEAASVEVLIKSYPQYIGVSQLPLSSDEQKINLVTALWERGLLMMEKPFK
ncbi:bifunctional lysine-specific demethylase and histidyl-hydroxylase NO66 [Musca autumnalis]|uniref:bifunctional lysine-specific demethylase and histidyl-hydroxylase NO66 n=1 Tax=Musca autumnalis TaxID=221902 RepID=UPI003CEED254